MADQGLFPREITQGRHKVPVVNDWFVLSILKGPEMSLLYSAGKWNIPPAIAGYEPIGIFLLKGIFPSSREIDCQVSPLPGGGALLAVLDGRAITLPHLNRIPARLAAPLFGRVD